MQSSENISDENSQELDVIKKEAETTKTKAKEKREKKRIKFC